MRFTTDTIIFVAQTCSGTSIKRSPFSIVRVTNRFSRSLATKARYFYMSEDRIPLQVFNGGTTSVQQSTVQPATSVISLQEAMATEINGVLRDFSDESKCLRVGQFLLALLETLIAAGLAVLAYFLRYTDKFPLFIRDFRCDDPSISYEYKPRIGQHYSLPLEDYGDAAFVLIIILCPCGLVLLKELFDCQTEPGFGYGTCGTCMATITRSWRILVSFLFGIFITSIIGDATKLSSGRLRPYFLSVCTKPCLVNESFFNVVDSSTIDPNTNLNETNVSVTNTRPNVSIETVHNDVAYCLSNVSDFGAAAEMLREARTSFPCSDLMLATFSALFVILYMYKRLNCSCLTMVKTCVSAAILVGLILLANSKLVTHQNYLDDVVFSIFLGVIISFYVIFMHLNTFTESHQLLGENTESVMEEFHIPRVVYRGSRRGKPTTGTTTATAGRPESIPRVPEIRIERVPNDGIVNPAFRPDSITRLDRTGFYN